MGVKGSDEAVVGPPPPFDQELRVTLQAIADQVPKLESLESIVSARTWSLPEEDLTRGGSYRLEDRKVPGPAGAPDISLLLCRPVDQKAPAPLFYYIHGGGMVIGDNRLGIANGLEIAAEFGATLVSVEYRLAPETPHPGPVEDCYSGLLWAAEHAAEIGGDHSRIVVFGISAGGGLAAATCLLARDRKGPKVAAQLLFAPMLDDRNDTPSAVQMQGLGVWDRKANTIGWTALLGEACGAADVSPYAAPARSTDLSKLPPTFIDVGSAETFRDEALDYARRIWCAGGVCELHVWSGGFHGYDVMAPETMISHDTRDARRRWLRRVVGRPQPATDEA